MPDFQPLRRYEQLNSRRSENLAMRISNHIVKHKNKIMG
jgi:hypothetical protein